MKALLVALSLFICGQAMTQAERIDTDRPDQTESAVTVPEKYFQGEFGFGKENSRGEDFDLIYPAFLVKYGIAKKIELRLEGNFLSHYIHSIPNTKATTSFEPIKTGVKMALFEEKGILPKTSLITNVCLPFTSTQYDKAQNIFPSFRFTFQNSLTENVGLGYNFGAEWDGYNRTPAWVYTFSPNFNIGKKWYAYIEAFGSLYYKDWAHALDGGMAYYVSNDTKLDLSGGIGLGNNPMKNYLALGFSFRVPFKEKYRLNTK